MTQIFSHGTLKENLTIMENSNIPLVVIYTTDEENSPSLKDLKNLIHSFYKECLGDTVFLPCNQTQEDINKNTFLVFENNPAFMILTGDVLEETVGRYAERILSQKDPPYLLHYESGSYRHHHAAWIDFGKIGVTYFSKMHAAIQYVYDSLKK